MTARAIDLKVRSGRYQGICGLRVGNVFVSVAVPCDFQTATYLWIYETALGETDYGVSCCRDGDGLNRGVEMSAPRAWDSENDHASQMYQILGDV